MSVVIFRCCVALASLLCLLFGVDAADLSRDGQRSDQVFPSSSSSSILMTTIFISVSVSIAAAFLFVCCAFFKTKRREDQVSDAEEGNTRTGTEVVTSGRPWHQLHVVTADNTGDAGTFEIHKAPAAETTIEMPSQSNGPRRISGLDASSMGLNPSQVKVDLESTGKETMEEKDPIAELPETDGLESVTLISEDFTGPGMTIEKDLGGEIFVKNVVRNGPAMKTRKVQEGDRIVHLAISTENMTLEHARMLLDLAKYYPLELRLKKRSTDASIHVSSPELEEPRRPSLSNSLQGRSKSQSVNYLPTSDDVTVDGLDMERQSSSVTQLPTSGELTSRWRFENQPRRGGSENEADVRVIGGKLQQGLPYKAHNDNDDDSDEDDEDLHGGRELAMTKSRSEDYVPPSSKVPEDREERFTSELNWSDLKSHFPDLGVNSENEIDQSLLADILPYLTDARNRQPATKSPGNEVEHLRQATKLNEPDEESVNGRESLDKEFPPPVWNDDSLNLESTDNFEIIKTRQPHKSTISNTNEDASGSLGISSQSQVNAVKNSREYYSDEESNEESEDVDDVDDHTSFDNASHIKSQPLHSKGQIDASGEGHAYFDKSLTDSTNSSSLSPELSLNYDVKTSNSVKLEENKAAAEYEASLGFPESQKVLNSELSFQRSEKTDPSQISPVEQPTTVPKHQTVSYYERYSETVSTGLPTNVVDLDVRELKGTNGQADIVTVGRGNQGQTNTISGTDLSKTDELVRADKFDAKRGGQVSPVLTKDPKGRSSSIGDLFRGIFSSKSTSKQAHASDRVNLSGASKGSSNGTTFVRAESKEDKEPKDSLSLEESAGYGWQRVDIKPHDLNSSSSDGTESQNIVQIHFKKTELGETQSVDTEEVLPDHKIEGHKDEYGEASEDHTSGVAFDKKDFVEIFNRPTKYDTEMVKKKHEEEEEEEEEEEGEEGDHLSACETETVSSSPENDYETQIFGIEDNLADAFKEDNSQKLHTEEETITPGAGSNGHDPNTNISDTIFDWSKLTLEPLELPWDSLGFHSTQQKVNGFGDEHSDTDSLDTKNDRTEDLPPKMKFNGGDLKREDKNNNLVTAESSDA